MRKTFTQFFALTRLTALETMRQPICLIITAGSLLFVALLPMLIAHRFGEANKVVRDSALAVHMLSGLILATYAAASTVIQEIRRGTVASILAKPVSRELFILAKFTGIAVVMFLYAAMMCMTTVLSDRSAEEAFHVDKWSALPILLVVPLAFFIGGAVNFFTRRPFSSNAFVVLFAASSFAFIFSGFFSSEGAAQSWGAGYNFQIVKASALVAMGVMILQGIATALSTRLQAIPTLSICTVVFMVGLLSKYFFGRNADTSAVANVVYRLLPDFQHFWMADQLTNHGIIPNAYMMQTSIYLVCYLGGILLLMVCAFRTMEIK